MMETTSENDFKVIIVGGSISGLTLAHTLHRAGISHVVLEKGKNITFDGGASISLQPNGLRILDQLGLYQDILRRTTPVSESIWRNPDGKVVRRSRFMQMVEERHGYPILCFERSELLDILYRRYERKGNIFTNCEVVRVESDKKGVLVRTKDGTKFTGHIVVGADGINSAVRGYLWDVEREKDPESARKAKASIVSDWFCAFGVSKHDFKDPDLFPGALQILYNSRRCNTIFSSTRDRTFWILIQKNDKRYTYPNIPRYATSKAEGIMERLIEDMYVSENTSMRDVWEKRTKFAMTSLEEVVLKRWWEGRVCLVGDSAHKMTPTAGQGGNTAIESIAVLANLLYDAKNGKGGSLDHDGICNIFKKYQESRNQRVLEIANSSGALTRIQTLDGLFWRIIATFLSMLGEDWETNSTSDLMYKSEALDFIVYQGQNGTVPWSGWSLAKYLNEPKNIRQRLAQILYYLVSIEVGWSNIRQLSALACWSSFVVPLKQIIVYGRSQGMGNANFTFGRSEMSQPLQQGSQWGFFAAGINLLPMGVIIAIEGSRAKNFRVWMNLPWIDLGVILAMRHEGYVSLAPLYLALRTTASTSSSRDSKGYIVPLKHAKSLLPALACAVGFWSWLAISPAVPHPQVKNGINLATSGSVMVDILILPLIVASVIANTKYRLPSELMLGHEDVPYLVGTLQVSAIFSAFIHICNAVYDFADVKIELDYHRSPWHRMGVLVFGGRKLVTNMRTIYWLLIAASIIWCLWNVVNIRRSQERTLWLSAKLTLLMFIGSVCIGPGATMALVWIGREDRTRCLDSRLRSTK